MRLFGSVLSALLVLGLPAGRAHAASCPPVVYLHGDGSATTSLATSLGENGLVRVLRDGETFDCPGPEVWVVEGYSNGEPILLLTLRDETEESFSRTARSFAMAAVLVEMWSHRLQVQPMPEPQMVEAVVTHSLPRPLILEAGLTADLGAWAFQPLFGVTARIAFPVDGWRLGPAFRLGLGSIDEPDTSLSISLTDLELRFELGYRLNLAEALFLEPGLSVGVGWLHNLRPERDIMNLRGELRLMAGLVIRRTTVELTGAVGPFPDSFGEGFEIRPLFGKGVMARFSVGLRWDVLGPPSDALVRSSHDEVPR